MYEVWVAYLLWFLGGFGTLGLHRFYLGKTGTGLLWLLSGGACYIGSVYDLFTLPMQVREANLRKRYRAAISSNQGPSISAPRAARKDSIERTILKTARQNSGFVTASEVALEGDISIESARTALEKLASNGMAEMRIRSNGVIVYVFAEFQKEGGMEFADI